MDAVGLPLIATRFLMEEFISHLKILSWSLYFPQGPMESITDFKVVFMLCESLIRTGFSHIFSSWFYFHDGPFEVIGVFMSDMGKVQW